jgi:hypothetical protein
MDGVVWQTPDVGKNMPLDCIWGLGAEFSSATVSTMARLLTGFVSSLDLDSATGGDKIWPPGDRWGEKEYDPDSLGKWLFAVRATRAWRIIPEDWRQVENLFPQAYGSSHPEFIGASGVPLSTGNNAARAAQEYR